jgi:hypothetical protein
MLEHFAHHDGIKLAALKIDMGVLVSALITENDSNDASSEVGREVS